MPTAKYFSSIPPFPDDVPIVHLPRLSLTKLIANDPNESANLFRGCRTDGFLQLDMNGSPEGEALLAEAETLFEINREVNDLSLDEKMEFEFQPQKSIFGYKRAGFGKVESGDPDRYEFYNTGQDDILGNAPRRMNPAPIENNRAIIKSYMLKAYAIVKIVLSHLDTHLRLPAGTFASLQRQTHISGSHVRMLKYAPQPDGDRRTSLLGHTDIGTVTILFSMLGGLQILPTGLDNTEENWRYVRPEPGCAVVNLGDAMVEWSAGILRSNLHRVTFAPGAQANCVRYSLAYFVRPEGGVSMQRLARGDSLIPGVEEGEEELDCNATEWEFKKVRAIVSGKDMARSRGGREIRVY